MLLQTCPYYTMFPLDFPLKHLRNAKPDEWVLDPFCGRGTTLYAARLLGLPASGVDVSPVAVAVGDAMLAHASIESVIDACSEILRSYLVPDDVPTGEFWELAYHPETLEDICRLRRAFLENGASPAWRLLRLILLGRLHGPLRKGKPTYLSNQMPRTYAPKPGYAVRFWRKRGLYPPRVDVLDLVKRKAPAYLSELPRPVDGSVALGDSREFDFLKLGGPYSWVVTSPPYFGMKSYIPDQWLRWWFLGGPPEVEYRQEGQIGAGGMEAFILSLRQAWNNVARACRPGAHLIVRFGVLPSARGNVSPESLLCETFRGTPWKVVEVYSAGSAEKGRRQARQFFGGEGTRKSVEEMDFVAHLGS